MAKGAGDHVTDKKLKRITKKASHKFVSSEIESSQEDIQ